MSYSKIDVDNAAKRAYNISIVGKGYQIMKIWVDPPSGWRYGFPKLWNDDYEPLEEFLVNNGYPQSEVSFAMKWVRMWKDDEKNYDDSLDGDFDSAMKSAGWGTDEDYGDFGDFGDDY